MKLIDFVIQHWDSIGLLLVGIFVRDKERGRLLRQIRNLKSGQK